MGHTELIFITSTDEEGELSVEGVLRMQEIMRTCRRIHTWNLRFEHKMASPTFGATFGEKNAELSKAAAKWLDEIRARK